MCEHFDVMDNDRLILAYSHCFPQHFTAFGKLDERIIVLPLKLKRIGAAIEQPHYRTAELQNTKRPISRKRLPRLFGFSTDDVS